MTVHVQASPPLAPRAIKRAPPCAMVIFGASGDLTKRKLVPALYRLFQRGSIGEHFAAVGVARREYDADAFRAEVGGMLLDGKPAERDGWERFAPLVGYVRGEFADPGTYDRLATRLAELDRERGCQGNRLFYLATPASEFETILHRLRDAGLIAPPGKEPFSRVIIEKPIGRDLDSARQLNQTIAAVLDESQTFRIDHYLGKETVQNIMVFRFANSIFEPIWNREHVEYVEISALETVGVERRGAFYEQTGVLRDIVQNHLLELLCLIAMEPPTTGDADDIRGEKLKVQRALRRLWDDTIERNVALGQYRGYREEPDVAPDSTVPTFASLRVFIDNWRWQGVPFYLRAGKKMAKRVTEISLHMQPVPLSLFGGNDVCEPIAPNVFTLRIQPDEGIEVRFSSKVPGHDLVIGSVSMDMKYVEAFGGDPPEAYERLLLDAMRGDPTLFSRRDAVEASWEWITPLLRYFEKHPPQNFPNYEPGCQVPGCATDLLLRDRRTWRDL